MPSSKDSHETFAENYEMEEPWIAVEPPSSPRALPRQANREFIHSTAPIPLTTLTAANASPSTRPPSFDAAQFDVILRRQRSRPPYGGGTKTTAVPSRFFHLSNTFEFSGWGTLSRIELEQPEIAKGEEDVQDARRAITLGQFTASALAGNAVFGSVFYALPAVVAVAGVL